MSLEPPVWRLKSARPTPTPTWSWFNRRAACSRWRSMAGASSPRRLGDATPSPEKWCDSCGRSPRHRRL